MSFSQNKKSIDLTPKILRDTLGVTYFCYDIKTQSKFIAKKIVIADSSQKRIANLTNIIIIDNQRYKSLDSTNKVNEEKIYVLEEIVKNTKEQKNLMSGALDLCQEGTTILKTENTKINKSLKTAKTINWVLFGTTVIEISIIIILIVII